MKVLSVDSSPSKKFFIDMITKDVTVESCILDLIDNSIDSYKRTKSAADEGEIEIKYSLQRDSFEILDNCGGMSKDIAQQKAFKFGNDMVRASNVLGMYGIGMKRSLFKIGENFEVLSKTEQDSFRVYMDRDEWLKLKEPNGDDIWRFYYEDVENNFSNGVHIKVTKLSSSLKEYLCRARNIEELKKKISSAYKDLLARKIKIKINGVEIISISDQLYESSILKSYVKKLVVDSVAVNIIAGVGDPSPKDAGWNIIANGRTIIERNKDELTGWEMPYDIEEESSIDEILNKKKVPAYHNDFARFRGYIFMNSDNSSILPLNTTKDGLDKQSPIYRAILREMIEAMTQILPKLRELQVQIRQCKNDMTVSPEEDFEEKSLEYFMCVNNQHFLLEIDKYEVVDKIKNIPLYIEARKVEQLKQYFDVTTNKDLGKEIVNFILGRIDLDYEQL